MKTNVRDCRCLPDGLEARFVGPDELATIDEEEQKIKIENHNLKRAQAQALRECNKAERLTLKEQQLETCRDMQVDVRLCFHEAI